MITIIVLSAIAIVLLVTFFVVNNKETSLRKEAEAEEKFISSVHDTMWKVLKEKAGVSEQYRKTFEKVYPELVKGRYSERGGNSMKWIMESNPDFDTSLYRDLMQAIDVQRNLFKSSQQRMLDIIRERDTLINTMPACWFIINKSTISYTVITSDGTNEIMRTRIDNDILSL